ncbi:MAG TPA: peptide-methionine (S)-S-oxide reductase MsrA [Gammaproteobacteria bacterium]|nr:peptide-methionine (S)-S-oxide reductase MsrA [Gammaproteobacteria bacterium]
MSDQRQKATFAGGCFWCMQPPYDGMRGVLETTVGYTGGETGSPTYEEVCAGDTGHAEAIEITFDPAAVSYRQLLEVFWRNIDPTTRDRQFCDVGEQYRTAIFYHDEQQRREAEQTRRELQESGRFAGAIVTRIEPAGTFYPAEDYHQAYYRKFPVRYKLYRRACGRDQFLRGVWG